jgi:hypothetical protein
MPRTVAIMQPTYLPYLGYFELIAQADVFVLLDDVQFERRSWQSRNRIFGAAGEVTLTVPVRKHARETLIRDVEIDDDQPWREKHLTSMRHAYGARPHFAEAVAFLEEALMRGSGRLCGLTGGLIEAAAGKLGLKAEIVSGSALARPGWRSDHLLEICRATGADIYLSTTGSRDYLEADGVFAAAGLPVRYHSFTPRPYPQGRVEFTPYMAFVDAVANLGWEATAAILDRG